MESVKDTRLGRRVPPVRSSPPPLPCPPALGDCCPVLPWGPGPSAEAGEVVGLGPQALRVEQLFADPKAPAWGSDAKRGRLSCVWHLNRTKRSIKCN